MVKLKINKTLTKKPRKKIKIKRIKIKLKEKNNTWQVVIQGLN
jgi:hypothetical protein